MNWVKVCVVPPVTDIVVPTELFETEYAMRRRFPAPVDVIV